ncbi:MAG: CcdB family protein [Tabrizicola sp.]
MADQFDLYLAPNKSLVVVLQSDALEAIGTRVFAPCLPADRPGMRPDRLAPAFFHAEREYRVMMHLMGAAPVHRLGVKVGTVAHLRDDIIRALDLLITGG